MGRAREAYNTIEPRGEVFRQLAQTMVVEKKGADLQTLLDVHRFNAVGDPIVIHYEAYAKLLNKDFGPALTLWSQAWQKQSDPIQKQQYVRDIALAVYNAGRGLDGYRAAPDKQVAFEALASHLVAKKKPDELLMLLTEHGKQHANNPWRTFYAGELALLRGDVAEAEQCFAGALDGASSTQRWQFRRGLQRAQIAAGKTMLAYRDAGGYTRAFEELAQLCADAKNPKQLSALIAEHRKNDPDDPVLLGWEIEASWLSGDYAKTLDEITKHQGELKRQLRFGDKFDGYLIRCLVKLNRAADAVREADAWAKAQRFRGGLFQVLAHAAAGDVKAAIDLGSQSGANRFTLEVWYADPDLGPLLRGDAMKAFRQRFPDPKPGL